MYQQQYDLSHTSWFCLQRAVRFSKKSSVWYSSHSMTKDPANTIVKLTFMRWILPDISINRLFACGWRFHYKPSLGSISGRLRVRHSKFSESLTHFDRIKFQPARGQSRVWVPAEGLQFRDGGSDLMGVPSLVNNGFQPGEGLVIPPPPSRQLLLPPCGFHRLCLRILLFGKCWIKCFSIFQLELILIQSEVLVSFNKWFEYFICVRHELSLSVELPGKPAAWKPWGELPAYNHPLIRLLSDHQNNWDYGDIIKGKITTGSNTFTFNNVYVAVETNTKT